MEQFDHCIWCVSLENCLKFSFKRSLSFVWGKTSKCSSWNVYWLHSRRQTINRLLIYGYNGVVRWTFSFETKDGSMLQRWQTYCVTLLTSRIMYARSCHTLSLCFMCVCVWIRQGKLVARPTTTSARHTYAYPRRRGHSKCLRQNNSGTSSSRVCLSHCFLQALAILAFLCTAIPIWT